jgi:hypothetical protein
MFGLAKRGGTWTGLATYGLLAAWVVGAVIFSITQLAA